ncbi:integral membrane protein, YccS/YhfK family [Salmonella enterica subsp. diarizonae]|uniref:Integral membrane protein, YccS/YhfK family n=1 Tax=Salmonella diarizonae TaxID=59204 RepID=A0A379TSJ5_SALDZ|nr:integral membrane protein, YccS/YhfK family [Salmonella enterica subsp. diarizonae]
MQSGNATPAGRIRPPAVDPDGLTLVLGVTAEISPLHARLLPASLIAAIFTLSLAGYMPVWEPLLIYALAPYGTACLTGFGSGYGANSRCASH